MKFLELEDKFKGWIENHRIKWILLLLILGNAFGFFENYLLGGELRQGLILSSAYCFLLITCELTLGGSGVN